MAFNRRRRRRGAGRGAARSPPSGYTRVFFAEGTHTLFCLVSLFFFVRFHKQHEEQSALFAEDIPWDCCTRLQQYCLLCTMYSSLSTGNDGGGERALPRSPPSGQTRHSSLRVQTPSSAWSACLSSCGFMVGRRRSVIEDILWDYCTRLPQYSLPSFMPPIVDAACSVL